MREAVFSECTKNIVLVLKTVSCIIPNSSYYLSYSRGYEIMNNNSNEWGGEGGPGGGRAGIH